MESNINRERRLVIPKWRNFATTKSLGELQGTGNRKIIPFENELEIKKREWKSNHDFVSAMELLPYGNLKDDIINDAINYIKRYNYNQEFIENSESDELITLEDVEIYKKISKIKINLHQYPKNAIQWVELSWCYTILAQKEKAIKAMKIALQINNCNRFVIRSAVRLFWHYKEFEYAYYILRKNELTIQDPWVNATYIAVSQMLNRGINNINNTRYLIESNNFSSFDISELTCSLGNLELYNGKPKKAKRLFGISIVDPNDNVAAQLQWISKNKLQVQDIEKIKIDRIKNNYEYATMEKCYLGKFDEAMENAKKWEKDEAISSVPNLIVADIYSSICGEYEKSDQKIKQALKKEKDDIKIKIQLAYNSINLGKIDEAEEMLNEIEKTNSEKKNEIFILADRGLIMFKKGMEEKGEKYYREAAKLADKTDSLELKASAIFHLAREKHEHKCSTALETVKEAREMYKYIKDPLLLHSIRKFEEKIEDKSKNIS